MLALLCPRVRLPGCAGFFLILQYVSRFFILLVVSFLWGDSDMVPESEKRIVQFDPVLQIEAYRFQGVQQKFPNHFHPYYVIGLIESGERRLFCQQMEWIIRPGDLLLFQPLMNHACESVDNQPLDYRCLNIKTDVITYTARMLDLPILPGKMLSFPQPVVLQAPEETVNTLRKLHQMIMSPCEGEEILREEQYLLLMEQVLTQYIGETTSEVLEKGGVVQACTYLEGHFGERVTLEELSSLAGMGKYRLIREFAREKGITPYRYLEAVRVNAAKRLLEEGIPPAEAAVSTGFSDQSHFSNAFKAQIGLTPKQFQKIFKDFIPGHQKERT